MWGAAGQKLGIPFIIRFAYCTHHPNHRHTHTWKKKEKVQKEQDNCERNYGMKKVLRHFIELELKVKWQGTIHAPFLSAMTEVTIPGLFTVRLKFPLLSENRSSLSIIMEIMSPPVFSCRSWVKFPLAVDFSLGFLQGTLRENGHFVCLYSVSKSFSNSNYT